MAVSPLVLASSGDVDGPTSTVAALQDMPGTSHLPQNAIPGPSGGGIHFREEFTKSLASFELDEADVSFLTGHLADQSASSYFYAFEKFKIFCSHFHVDPYSCSPSYLVKFLRTKFESGASYSTICFFRSAVSKFHNGIGSQPLGQHHLVAKAVKAAFRLRPPLPKYRRTFDITPVLNYISGLEPLEELSLKNLTYKAFFLLSFSSLSRVSSVSRLRRDVEETQVQRWDYIELLLTCIFKESLIVPFGSLEKQGRPANVRGHIQLLRNFDNPSLCPVLATLAYLRRVSLNAIFN